LFRRTLPGLAVGVNTSVQFCAPLTLRPGATEGELKGLVLGTRSGGRERLSEGEREK
jgi:hypothetical protein